MKRSSSRPPVVPAAAPEKGAAVPSVSEAPSKPAWFRRLALDREKQEEQYTIRPGTYLSRQFTKLVLTRAELQRREHNVERLLRLGLIELVKAEAQTQAPAPVPATAT